MTCLIRTSFARATAAVFAVVALGAQAQMSLPGKFAVSQSGAATYTIPLQVPPGVAGLEPKLSLTYSSQAGNGYLGVGWSLAGLSSITRCPQTAAQDGPNWRGGLDYAVDRFCLDGQRLVAVPDPNGGANAVAGAYGADKTFYSTERESFSRVQSIGYAGIGNLGGAASFVVKTATGLTMEYGTAADSKIWASTFLGIRVWALSKVTDASGNYMTFTYATPDSANGQHYPSRIDYTGNAGSSPALAPTKTVFFDFESGRADTAAVYQGGGTIRMLLRLSAIRMTTGSGNVPVHTYSMLYGQADPDSDASRLVRITDCDAAGTCLLATSATYGTTSPTFDDTALGVGASPGYWPGYLSSNNQPFHFVGDFNGDGKADVAFFNNGWNVLTRSNGAWSGSNWGNGTGPGYWTSFNTASSQRFQFTGDFNGDGKTDLMYWDGGGWRVLLSTGAGWTEQAWGKGSGSGYWPGYAGASSQPFHFTGDFNGDGKTDFMYWDNAAWRVLLSTGSGWSEQVWGKGSGLGYFQGYASRAQQFQFVGDFNGDGKSDYMYWDNTAWRVLLSTGSGWFEQSWGKGSGRGYWAGWANATTQAFHFIGDFNGDGKTDFMYWDDTTWQVLLSTGKDWVTQNFGRGDGLGFWSAHASPSSQPFQFVGDFNGDGRSDFLYWEDHAGWKALLSTGQGWKPQWLGPGTGAGYWTDYAQSATVPFHLVGDFTGDGRDDFAYWHRAQWRLLSQSGHHLMTEITSKLRDSRTPDAKITYGTPSQLLGSRYSQSVAAVAPQVAVAPTWPVVTDVDVGAFQTRTSYWYDSAVIEVSTGRGFSGFNYVQKQDLATGLVSRSTWRRDFPFAGLEYQTATGTSLANWSNLGVTVNQYVFENFSGNCRTSPGMRYFVYQNQTDSIGNRDVNPAGGAGGGLPGNRTTRVMDGYGNATRVVSQVLDPDNNPAGVNTVTTNNYINDLAGWRLGRLMSSTVTTSTEAPFIAEPVTGCISAAAGTGGDASGNRRTIQPVKPGQASSL
ncbi:SpvB/TcaC N-terminal domain-containing protein [Rhizobacter sp. SG703]|uniref:SpvB/TcaC N-terminal domain-containing protein n=1 Tax=Rhizobacter sp. SG703 TaxID=2587140 RepID=UPI001444E24E|nr:SpvB/TcaC N-terminal domain-containing protein [Rhizobacter sp. SG703]NKI94387.1 hypothetical protein [Rhizobacter sp. SG703]